MSELTRHELDEVLHKTLDDQRLSRSERRALREVFADYQLDSDARAFVQSRVFALARACLKGEDARKTLDWAEEVIKVVHAEHHRDPTIAEVHFSPGDECRRRIQGLLNSAQKRIDICVFTITDDRLAEPILQAHRRGVDVRIISDDEKSGDAGSDVRRLAAAGVQVRVDESEHHMHHKFAVFDYDTVLTGSYNWTRSAAEYNRENVVVTDDPKIVEPYRKGFDVLWDRLGQPA